MTLIENLAKGWSQNHDEQAQGFAHRWEDKFQTDVHVKQSGDNSLSFANDLRNIHLHGMTNVHCLLLGGEGVTIEEALLDFNRHFGGSGSVSFVLATSQAAYAQAQATLPAGRYLLLSPAQLEQLFTAQEPTVHLKQWLRNQIPLRRLIPFTHLLSVEGGMFFGRRSELEKLDSDVSFAVAGPGRIGKTSLVKQYHYKLLCDQDPQASRTFYVDFYHCSKDPNIIARFLAMKLEASRRGDEVNVNKLQDFLQYQRSKLGGTLNLFLDEVDNVCQSEAFSVLGEAAKLHYCRLILIGKGDLLSMMLYSDSQLKQRLQLLQLNPLDENSARSLLLEPLADMGFKVDNPDRLVEQVFLLTGRLPHLMQFFARKLVDLTLDEKKETISASQVETLKWDFETAQFFISPLQDKYLENAEVRLIAFLFLKERPREITPGHVRLLAARWGMIFDEMKALKICNELVIHNLFVWNKSGFQIANEALVDYAQHLGILDSAIETAYRAVHSSSNKLSSQLSGVKLL